MITGNHMVAGADKVLDKKGTCSECHEDALEGYVHCQNWGDMCRGILCHNFREWGERCPNRVIKTKCRECGSVE